MANGANFELPPWLTRASIWESPNNVGQLGAIFQRGQALGLQRRAQALEEAAFNLKMEADMNQRTGLMEMSAVMAEGARNNAYTDPAWKAKFWSTAQRYPQLQQSPRFDELLNVLSLSERAKSELDQIRLRHNLELQQPPTPTTDIRNIDQLSQWRRELTSVEAAGDVESANELRQKISQMEGQLTPSGETIRTYDAQGNLISEISRGRGTASGLTPAVQTDVQKRLLAFDKASSMSKRLVETLGPLDVGIAGWGQQVLINEGLAQLFPSLANQRVTDARTLLGNFRQNMIKVLKVDAQANREEEKRILGDLPKAGADESLPSAIAKIIRSLREIHSIASFDADKIGAPAPPFPLSPPEIKGLFTSGKLERNLALELLRNYYPEIGNEDNRPLYGPAF